MFTFRVMESATSTGILPRMQFNRNSDALCPKNMMVLTIDNSSEVTVAFRANLNDKKINLVGGLSLRHLARGKNFIGPTYFSARVCTYPRCTFECHTHTAKENLGVMLLNLGGPETLHDVQPFLFNLFADPDIIRLPRPFRFLQRPLAQLISILRAPKSKEGYAAIGGGSPLRKITDEQANALKLALENKDVSANVYVAMRYWHPFTEEAVHQASHKNEITSASTYANSEIV